MERAAADNLTASDAEVSTRFTDFKKNYTEEKFQEFLKEQGFTEEEFKQTLRKGATIEKLYNKDITSKISVTEAEIDEHFEREQSQLQSAQGMASHPYSDNGHQGLQDQQYPRRRRHHSRRVQKKSPASDAAPAERRGFFPPGGGVLRGRRVPPSGAGTWASSPSSNWKNASPALKNAVMNLKVEQVYPRPVRIGYGYHLVKLLAKERGGQHELSEPQVQADIRQTIFNRKETLLKTAFLEVIRNEAQIRNVLAENLLDSQ